MNPDQDHAKLVEINASKTLEFNPSLSAEQEDKLCTILRQHLDAFSWDCKEIERVHPSVYTHHIYIKEGCKPMHQS